MNQGKITGYCLGTTGSIPVARSVKVQVRGMSFEPKLKLGAKVLKIVTGQASWRA
jgi:hypothetical protein